MFYVLWVSGVIAELATVIMREGGNEMNRLDSVWRRGSLVS